MSTLPVLVFIEKSQLIPFVEALLQPHAVEVRGGFTHSGTFGRAEASLEIGYCRAVTRAGAAELTSEPMP